ncbi:hypothetical protein BCR35DRAFT_303800 [Leucosporidium creatinivorum]|uniref:Uncharacterized protein n=1 Tax=Leucosporidium creatinivorum TaxID=106004 RepID=A0A1Y2FEL6_9BASI|nr:hypothetical protein BCR35DRAFT_303800 [Leucosporidium creatinivorum]
MLSFSAVALTALLATASSANAASSTSTAATAATSDTATVGSPVLNHCQTAAFKYTCLATPCMMAMRPSNDSGSSYAIFQGLSEASGSVAWAPYVSAGTNLTAYIYDEGGNPNYSGALIVGEGASTCDENLGYSISDGVTSTVGSTGSATSGSAKAASSTSAGTANATTSAAGSSSTDSGASKMAQGTAALALVGAGVAALLI